jgi:hypothetical protein
MKPLAKVHGSTRTPLDIARADRHAGTLQYAGSAMAPDMRRGNTNELYGPA